MVDLAPHEPYRPLVWPDVVADLQDVTADLAQPVYIVGGAVRDALLGRPVTDIDLAVANGGIALARRLTNALHGDCFVLDAQRDVGRVLIDTPEGRLIIDVARFRGDDLAADLADRDFTINAMAVELTGDISLLIDPLGGAQDARDRLLRRCLSGAVAEDPIRALRAVRQSVQLAMHIDRETLQDVRAAAGLLGNVSAERVRDEFVKVLALPKARAALRVADALGLLRQIVPETEILKSREAHSADYDNAWPETLAVVEKTSHLLLAISPRRTEYTGAAFGVGMLVMQLDRYRRQLQTHTGRAWPNERPHGALLALAALLREIDPNVVADRAKALRLSNGERDRLVTIVRAYRLPLEMQTLSALEIHRFWWRTGEAGVDACLLAAADYLGGAASQMEQDRWLEAIERLRILLEAYYERHADLVEPPVLLDGNQLMSRLGLERGPMIGKLLDRIREAQVTGDVRSADEALELARRSLDDNQR